MPLGQLYAKCYTNCWGIASQKQPRSLVTVSMTTNTKHSNYSPISGSLRHIRPLAGFLKLIIVSLILIVTLANHSPARLIAQQHPQHSLDTFLQLAENAVALQQWDKAKDYYRNAMDLPANEQASTVQEQLRQHYAYASLQARYADGSMASYVRSLNRQQACQLLSQTWLLIQQNYYQDISLPDLANLAIWQLQVATQEPSIYQLYYLTSKSSPQTQSLARLNKQITDLRLKLLSRTDYDLHDLMPSIHQLCNLSEKTDLGSAWPAAELACALADSLGKYSHILSPRQSQAMHSQLDGLYVGLGVDLLFEDEYPLVFDVVPDSPANNADITPGDLIIKINGNDIKHQTAAQIGKLLTGPENSSVQITIRRKISSAGNPAGDHTVKLTRTAIQAPSVRYIRLIDNDRHIDNLDNISLPKPIGYLRISNFDFNTAQQLQNAVDDLIKRRAHALMIDLRNNGGGVVSAAVDAVRLFIDSGTIVTLQSPSEKLKYSAGGDYFHCYHIPIAILVDKNTASAAEIFAAALKDNHRAVIIGEKTMGKAVVQTIYDLNLSLLQSMTSADSTDAASLCITTATYLPPSNISFNLSGITPDILIENPQNSPENAIPASDYLSLRNTTVKKAIDYLAAHFSS